MKRPVNTGIVDTNNTTILNAAETDLEQVKDDIEKKYKILHKSDQCIYDEILHFENKMFNSVDTLSRFFIEIQKTIIVCMLLGTCFNAIVMLILWRLLAQ